MKPIQRLDVCSRPGLGAIFGLILIAVTASLASADRADEAWVAPAVVEVLSEQVGTRDEKGQPVGTLRREELPTPPFAVIDVVSGHVLVETRESRTVVLDRSDVVLNLQDATVDELCELLSRERTRGSPRQPGGCADRSRVPDPDELD